MPAFPWVVDLTTLTATGNGFVISGGDNADLAGFTVASAGDINGDGFDDYMVNAAAKFGYSGTTYVFFGKASGFTDFDLAGFSASEGFKIQGGASFDTAGGGRANEANHALSAGDINGDGFDDIIIGAHGYNRSFYGNLGKAVVIYGKASGFSDVTLANLYSSGFYIRGDDNGDKAGWSVASAGDINGDGYDEIMVGAPGGDNGGSDAGETYIIFGKLGGFSTLDLTTFTATDGFTIQGDLGDDRMGSSVSSAGDVNGDGYDDLLIGAPLAGASDNGAAYVIFGKASGFSNIDLSSLSASDGFTITGAAAGDHAGTSVSTAGDINGDGYDDLIIGAPYSDAGGTDSGATYIVFGKATGLANIDLATLNPSDGFALTGAGDDWSGRSVSAAGDVNNDGYDDIIVGAHRSDLGGGDSGAAYVLFGRADGFGNLALNAIKPTDGFIIAGDVAGDWAGWSVSSAGDINNDGFDDIMVGAITADTPSRANPGKAFVIFGRDTSVAFSDLDGDTVTFTDSEGPARLDDSSGPELLAGLVTDQGSLYGATLTISITANENAGQDLLGISTAGTISLSSGTNVGSIVSVGGIAVGTISSDGNGGDDLVIDFDTADATPARLQTLIRALTYSNSNIEPSTATRTVSIDLDAGGIGSASATVQVDVVAANNEPTVTATALNPTFTEGDNAVDLFSGVTIGGLESGQGITSVVLQVTNVSGELGEVINIDGTDFSLVHGTFGSTSGSIGVGVSISVSGSTATVQIASPGSMAGAEAQALIDGLDYRNDQEDLSEATRVFTITQLWDDGSNTAPDDAVANPGLSSSVTMVAVDDTPIAFNDSIAVSETWFLDDVDIISDDYDPDGPDMQVGAVNGSAANVDTQIQLGSGALLTMSANGTFDYDPNGAFDYLISTAKAAATGAVNVSATDSFTYTLVGGDTATVTVTINGEDSAGDELWGNAGNNVINGTGERDVFVLCQGGNDSASGQGGNDFFLVGATFDGLDSINGGADFDWLFLDGDYATSPLVLSATSLCRHRHRRGRPRPRLRHHLQRRERRRGRDADDRVPPIC